jgi:hypothetical protein
MIKRYQRGNQKLYMEGQITQWSKDIKGATRSSKCRVVICSSIYSFWLPLWYLLVIVLSVSPFTASDCPFGILWSLCYLSLHLQFLIAPLISFGHCVICLSIYSFWLPLWYLLVIVLSVPPFTASDCPFGIFWSLCYLSLHLQLPIAPLISFGHCVICPSISTFWLPLWLTKRYQRGNQKL